MKGAQGEGSPDVSVQPFLIRTTKTTPHPQIQVKMSQCVMIHVFCTLLNAYFIRVETGRTNDPQNFLFVHERRIQVHENRTGKYK